MSENTADLQQTLALALKLSPADKAELIEQLAATLEDDLATSTPKPRRSLLGVLAHYGDAPSAEEIDEARREMWGNFPREDI